MAFINLKNMAEFKELISQDKLVLVDFHATWCGPCRVISPRLDRLASEHPDAIFVKVDVDDVPDVATEYQVRSMPTIMYFRKGEKLGEVVGANMASIASRFAEFNA